MIVITHSDESARAAFFLPSEDHVRDKWIEHHFVRRRRRLSEGVVVITSFEWFLGGMLTGARVAINRDLAWRISRGSFEKG